MTVGQIVRNVGQLRSAILWLEICNKFFVPLPGKLGKRFSKHLLSLKQLGNKIQQKR